MHCAPQVAVALKETVYLWNGSSGTVSQLCTLPEVQDGEERYVCSLSWAADGNFLAVGTSDAKVWAAGRVAVDW